MSPEKNRAFSGNMVGYEVFSPATVASLVTKQYNNSVYSADELFHLYMSDSYFEKALHAQTIEALRYWVKLPEDTTEDPSNIHKPEILQVTDWSRVFGFSIVAFLDSNPELKNPLLAENEYKLNPWHPFVSGVGGIVRWDLDANNYPTNFYVKTHNDGPEIMIHASRVVVFSNNWKTGHWRGCCDLSSVLSDVNGMRKQRSAISDRADQYPVAGAVISTSQDVTDDDQEAAQDAFDPISVLVVKDASVHPIGGLLSPNELETAIGELKESTIVGTGYAKSDILGATAGAKLSEDKNRDMKNVRYQVIQMTFERPVKQVFEKLGLEWLGWAKADELSKGEKITAIQTLVNAFNSCSDEGMKQIVANVTKDVFKTEAAGVKIDTSIDEPELEDEMNAERQDKPSSGPAGTRKRWFQRGK